MKNFAIRFINDGLLVNGKKKGTYPTQTSQNKCQKICQNNFQTICRMKFAISYYKYHAKFARANVRVHRKKIVRMICDMNLAIANVRLYGCVDVRFLCELWKNLKYLYVPIRYQKTCQSKCQDLSQHCDQYDFPAGIPRFVKGFVDHKNGPCHHPSPPVMFSAPRPNPKAPLCAIPSALHTRCRRRFGRDISSDFPRWTSRTKLMDSSIWPLILPYCTIFYHPSILENHPFKHSIDLSIRADFFYFFCVPGCLRGLDLRQWCSLALGMLAKNRWLWKATTHNSRETASTLW